MRSIPLFLSLIAVWYTPAGMASASPRAALIEGIARKMEIPQGQADTLLTVAASQLSAPLQRGEQATTDQVVESIAKKVRLSPADTKRALRAVLDSLRLAISEDSTYALAVCAASQGVMSPEKIVGLLEMLLRRSVDLLGSGEVYLIEGQIAQSAKRAKVSLGDARVVLISALDMVSQQNSIGTARSVAMPGQTVLRVVISGQLPQRRRQSQEAKSQRDISEGIGEFEYWEDTLRSVLMERLRTSNFFKEVIDERHSRADYELSVSALRPASSPVYIRSYELILELKETRTGLVIRKGSVRSTYRAVNPEVRHDPRLLGKDLQEGANKVVEFIQASLFQSLIYR